MVSSMLISFVKRVSFIVAIVLPVAQVQAEQLGVAESRPVVRVAETARIQGEEVTLGDIASIVAKPGFEELEQQLRSVALGVAPLPTEESVLQGTAILEAISKAGIELDSIGYVIPRKVRVSRDGRVLSYDEVLAKLRVLAEQDTSMDISVRDVQWARTQIVPNGETQFEIEWLGQPAAGKLPMRVEVVVNGDVATRFLATALVDDWREVPVITKNVQRGRLVSAEDISIVRLNMKNQPEDIITDLQQVVGRRAKSTLARGQTIRQRSIDIPPVIPRGKRVTIEYNLGALHASATGVALDDGLDSATIRVKNESSRRIIRARVVNAEVVEVLP